LRQEFAQMTMTADGPTVQPVPEGFHTITPSLVIEGAAEAIAFYARAFNAVELHRATTPDGKKIMHATLRIGNANLMLADDFPEWHAYGPSKFGGSAVSMHLYVEDADALFAQAVAAGATVTMPIDDVFWGDRYGRVKDPFGHEWAIASQTRVVDEAELKRVVDAWEACANQPGQDE